jgi:signal transduction histidine kinase
MAVVSVLSTAASIPLYLHNRAHTTVSYVYGDYLAGVLYTCVGAFLLRRRPDNPVGWVFAGTSVLGINALAGQYAVAAALVHPSWPLDGVAGWLGSWTWVPELAVPAVLPLLFPDGTLASRRWRPIAVLAFSAVAVACVGIAFSRHPLDASEAIYNPWALPHSWWLLVVGQVAVAALFLCSVLGVISLVLRTRSARGQERAQLQWLMLAGLVTVLLAVSAALVPAGLSEAVFAVAMAAIPAGVVIAVARHGLLDIELVLNRTIVYVLLTGVVVLGYVAAVSVVGEVAAQKLGIAAVAVLALLVASARDRVQRVVDHALFGDRRDPYAVVNRLGQRVDAAADPLEALEEMASELRAALRLPSVAILPTSPQVLPVEVGSAVAGTIDLPISAHGVQLGTLRVGNRHHGERLREEEHSVLQDVARRAGALLQAASLIADLRTSRDRIVAAREEERRRLRHDLHDGVGPQLAGLALQLDSLTRRLDGDAESAARVQVLRDRLRDTVSEVRRVVDDLRPPALDDLGLVEAVRQQVSAYAVVGSAGSAPLVTVDSPTPLPALPAAVEVAAYRIVTEAVANAVRHGQPSSCAVGIGADPKDLVVTITDNGSGIAEDATPGVGLASMKERAAEVGGTLTIDSQATRGTIVTARLPLELM